MQISKCDIFSFAICVSLSYKNNLLKFEANSTQALSHVAIFCECDCNKKGLCGCQWDSSHGATVMDLCVCDINRFHTHSVWVQYFINTDYSHTMWTNSLKSQGNILKNAPAVCILLECKLVYQYRSYFHHVNKFQGKKIILRKCHHKRNKSNRVNEPWVFPKSPPKTKLAFLPTTSFLLIPLLVTHKLVENVT